MRIGVDLGGTKIEAAVIGADSVPIWRERVRTPSDDYPATLEAIRQLIERMEHDVPRIAGLPVGIGTPGAVSRIDALMKNCNSTTLNGKPFPIDIERILQRPVRIANDANCFVLSEALHGAGRDARSVFGAILGTGTGGGLVIDGVLIEGANRIAGEWGHNSLSPQLEIKHGEIVEPLESHHCYCGRVNCVEIYLCGPGVMASYLRMTGEALDVPVIMRRRLQGELAADYVFRHFAQRLARSLAMVINIVDPDVIVLGGGLSNIPELYKLIPGMWAPYVFSDRIDTRLVAAEHGDSSGVIGAAWLWPDSL